MIQIPGYVIRSEIGRGGMATVYRAVQTSLDREVALKVMSSTMVSDPSFSRRFLQEARTLASLTHPNIVAVYDVGVTPEQSHYFSMQLLPGGDFLHRVQNGVSEKEIARVLLGVARALGFAHQRGFVHRDVAPGNILFDSADTPVLTDFGIARALTQTSRITNAGVSVGTSHYMSPEQARGGDVDGRSDIYSLGAVAFESLTGKPPYDGDDGFAIAYAHVFEPVPKLPANLSRWQPFIDRAMAKEPKDRFADMAEVQQVLGDMATQLGLSDSSTLVAGAVIPPVAPVTSETSAKPLAPAIPAPATPAAPAMESKAPPAPVAAPATTAPATPPSPPMAAAKPNVLTDQETLRAQVAVSAPLAKDHVSTSETQNVPPKTAAEPVLLAASEKTPRPPKPPVVKSSTPETTAASSGGKRALWMVPVLLALLLGGGYFVWTALKDRQSKASTDPITTVAETPNTTEVQPNTGTVPNEATPPLTGETTTPSETPVETATEGGVTAVDGVDPTAAIEGETPPIEADPAQMQADPVAELIRLAQADLRALRLTNPPKRNAYERYKEALKLDSQSAIAKQGVVDVAGALLKVAEARINAGKWSDAVLPLKRAGEIAAEWPEGKAITQAVKTRRENEIARAQRDADAAEKSGRRADAQLAWQRLLAFDPSSKTATDALARLAKSAESSNGSQVQDAAGPALAVVNINGRKLAIAKTETTVAEFQRYWNERGSRARGERPACRDREGVFRSSKSRTWKDPGFKQNGSNPVVCVNADDAQDYVKWLSEKTGRKYRLLTEDEWRAVARQSNGGQSCRGNLADQQFAKTFSEKDALKCDDGHAFTAPVGRFASGSAGVFDIAGNVREWVRCSGACKEYAAMGSAWNSDAKNAAAEQRETFLGEVASNTIGFRVARDVE